MRVPFILKSTKNGSEWSLLRVANLFDLSTFKNGQMRIRRAYNAKISLEEPERGGYYLELHRKALCTIRRMAWENLYIKSFVYAGPFGWSFTAVTSQVE